MLKFTTGKIDSSKRVPTNSPHPLFVTEAAGDHSVHLLSQRGNP